MLGSTNIKDILNVVSCCPICIFWKSSNCRKMSQYVSLHRLKILINHHRKVTKIKIKKKKNVFQFLLKTVAIA